MSSTAPLGRRTGRTTIALTLALVATTLVAPALGSAPATAGGPSEASPATVSVAARTALPAATGASVVSAARTAASSAVAAVKAAATTAVTATSVSATRAAVPSAVRVAKAALRRGAPYHFATARYNHWYAKNYMAAKYGWGKNSYKCLAPMWGRESAWNEKAHNSGSGAHGIPQAMPGNKMASFGADWRSNPTTQIKWGLNYIKKAYGSPCQAWAFWQSHNWY